MIDQSPSDGFRRLWPTLFLQRVLPDHGAANEHLLSLIVAKANEQSELTTDYLQQNFFSQQDPAVEWLKTCVNKTVTDYLQQQELSYSLAWSLQAWANVNRYADYHSLHNHPHSYLSGTYYVSVPEQTLLSEQRKDLNPAAISFFDPRAQANMNAIAGDNQVEAEFRVDPSDGMILLWPSFLHHLVHPNMSNQLRVSISFNVLLKWSDDFIPAQ